MSRARTLKEIEDRRAQYSKRIWSAVLLSIVASVLGISVYIGLGLPSYFIFGELPNVMLMASFLTSIFSAVSGYLSKSGVMRGEYGSANKLLNGAVALATISLVVSASAITPLIDPILNEICQAVTTSVASLPACLANLHMQVYAGFGAYLALLLISLIFYILARGVLKALFAYYAPRPIRRS